MKLVRNITCIMITEPTIANWPAVLVFWHFSFIYRVFLQSLALSSVWLTISALLVIVLDVEEGGETAFPQLNLAVKPKKGNAILWPSTIDSNPEQQEMKTFHEARPVIKGHKVAANSWIHLYNYEKPNLWGCTGSFDELWEKKENSNLPLFVGWNVNLNFFLYFRFRLCGERVLQDSCRTQD